MIFTNCIFCHSELVSRYMSNRYHNFECPKCVKHFEVSHREFLLTKTVSRYIISFEFGPHYNGLVSDIMFRIDPFTIQYNFTNGYEAISPETEIWIDNPGITQNIDYAYEIYIRRDGEIILDKLVSFDFSDVEKVVHKIKTLFTFS